MSKNKFDTYDSHLFTSGCCNAFNIYDGSSIICSNCHSIISHLGDDEVLTVHVKFNGALESNVSGDIVNAFKKKASRFSDDKTCLEIDTECKKCGHKKSRYLRDPQGNAFLVCSNRDCRNVFEI